MAIGTCFALDDDRPRGDVMRSIADTAGPAVGSTRPRLTRSGRATMHYVRGIVKLVSQIDCILRPINFPYWA
jgi:hypothetical protein